jgi:hypothetical protein
MRLNRLDANSFNRVARSNSMMIWAMSCTKPTITSATKPTASLIKVHKACITGGAARNSSQPAAAPPKLCSSAAMNIWRAHQVSRAAARWPNPSMRLTILYENNATRPKKRISTRQKIAWDCSAGSTSQPKTNSMNNPTWKLSIMEACSAGRRASPIARSITPRVKANVKNSRASRPSVRKATTGEAAISPTLSAWPGNTIHLSASSSPETSQASKSRRASPGREARRFNPRAK